MDLTVVRHQVGGMYFTAYCQEAGRNVLLGSDNFVDLRDGPSGFELHYRCYCGRNGVLYPQRSNAASCAA